MQPQKLLVHFFGNISDQQIEKETTFLAHFILRKRQKFWRIWIRLNKEVFNSCATFNSSSSTSLDRLIRGTRFVKPGNNLVSNLRLNGTNVFLTISNVHMLDKNNCSQFKLLTNLTSACAGLNVQVVTSVIAPGRRGFNQSPQK